MGEMHETIFDDGYSGGLALTSRAVFGRRGGRAAAERVGQMRR